MIPFLFLFLFFPSKNNSWERSQQPEIWVLILLAHLAKHHYWKGDDLFFLFYFFPELNILCPRDRKKLFREGNMDFKAQDKEKLRTRTLEIYLLGMTENKQINLLADVVPWAVALLWTVKSLGIKTHWNSCSQCSDLTGKIPGSQSILEK